jgi:hypothetical protein
VPSIAEQEDLVGDICNECASTVGGARHEQQLHDGRLRQRRHQRRTGGRSLRQREQGRIAGRHGLVLIEPLRRGQLLVACPPCYADAFEEAFAARIPPPIGCANAANLAHRAAVPGELVTPPPLGALDAGAASAAVQRHRAGRVIPPPPFGPISAAVAN